MVFFLVLALAMGARAQWVALNDDWEMLLTFDGRDLVTQYGLGPDTGQIILIQTETEWPDVPLIPQGARNFTQNAFLEPSWDCRGEIKATFRWRHTSTPPTTLRIKVSSPTWATTSAAGGNYEVESGIGADIEPIDFGEMAVGTYLRKVRIGSNGLGEFVVDKVARSSYIGNQNSARAFAADLDISLDLRDVTITGENSNNWPSYRKFSHEIGVNLPASQDPWEWYDPIDVSVRPFNYSVYVPAPAELYYPSDSTDYSEWDLGFPTAFQSALTYLDGQGLPVTSYSPPQIDPVVSTFTGAVGGAEVGDSYSWTGLSAANSGTVTQLPLGPQLNYFANQVAPLNRKNMNTTSGTLTGSFSFTANAATLMPTIRFQWTFASDGLQCESIRLVDFHASREPGAQVSSWFNDYRVGPSPNMTSYQVALIVNPLGSPPNEYPELAGFITAGYDAAEFLPLSLGHLLYTGQNNTLFFAIAGAIPIPGLDYLVAAVEIGQAAGGSGDPGTVAATFSRDSYNAPGGNGRWCDYLRVDTAAVAGIKAFDDPSGLQSLKDALQNRGTSDLYWMLKMRPIEWFQLQEAHRWGPAGYIGQSFDRHAKQRPWPLSFKYYHFREYYP